jgi:hypothetical protein
MHDKLSSVRVLADAGGSVTANLDYDEFGAPVTATSNPGTLPISGLFLKWRVLVRQATKLFLEVHVARIDGLWKIPTSDTATVELDLPYNPGRN